MASVPPGPQTHLYATRDYAAALGGADRVIEAPEWGCCLLRRPISSQCDDVGGMYPLTILRSDSDLIGGLESLRLQGFVSAAVVPDPLLAPDLAALSEAFEVCRPFKQHFLIDRGTSPFAPTKHHRDRIRRGLRRCRVDCAPLAEHLPQWRALYAGLVAQRGIVGVADFPPSYFDMLAAASAVTAFVARAEDDVVGMTLWFAADGVVYNHLTAVNEAGYRAGASYALYDAAIAHFADGVINLGGGAGVGDGAGGLADFKRGFANAEVQALICGAVLDRDVYDRLSQGVPRADFFPAYRAPRA